MIEAFNGFSAATIEFLKDLRDNNNKEWFELHKPDYRHDLLEPLQALAAGLGPFMLSIDPDLEVSPARTISRIYRDTRFSRDKSPYKTSHWITFKRLRQEWQDFPAFFFEISPDSYRYGMGFYSASRQTMDNFRSAIDSKPTAFRAAISCCTRQKTFTIEGEQYKRPLKADVPGEFQDWYHRKSLYLVCNRQIEGNSIDKKLIKDLRSSFEMITPLYQFLCKVAV
jgi:uncharacterized protein (TIGR02453 family)